MSATRDQSQKFTFVYSNLYHLYKKGNEAAKAAIVPPPMRTKSASAAVSIPVPESKAPNVELSRVLKSRDLHEKSPDRISEHVPPRLMGKRLQPHRPLQSVPARAEALEGLKENLKTLQGLHERLRFMLKELEEITKPSSQD